MAHNEYKDERYRTFWFVQKVENLPDDWKEICKGLLIPMAYVIHDKDVYSEQEEMEDPKHKAGTPKSDHVHFLVYFAGKRTCGGVCNMVSKLNIWHVEPVPYKNGALAYMLHIGQPEKHLYGFDEMVIINGLKVNFADINDVDFGDVMDFAKKWNVTRFVELCQVAKREDPPIFRFIQGHYALCNVYLTDMQALQAEIAQMEKTRRM